MKHIYWLGALALVVGLAFLSAPDAHAAIPSALHAASGLSDWHWVGTIAGAFAIKSGGSPEPDVEIKQLSVELKRVTDEIKGFAEKAEKEIKSTGVMAAELKTQSDEALVKHNEIAARMTEVEQKLARRGGGDATIVSSTVGHTVIDNAEVKAFMARPPARGGVRVDVKAITSVTTNTDGAAGDLIVPDRQQGIIAPPERRMTVRDLITPGRTASNAIQYVKETGFTNAAATAAETTQKPESTMKFDLITAAVATIAHFVYASKQILADAPMLQSYIDGRLRYGLAFVEELQLLKGDGTGSNLLGIIPQATAYAAPFALTGATMIDQLRLAMLQAVLAEFPATGHVMNPIDWTRIELTKDGEGRYIIGQPQGTTPPSLWRLPVVETQAIDVDKFLTGAFKLGAQIFDREDANVEISTEDRDNFIKNMVTIRAEERLGLAVYRPEAFIYGDFGNV